MVQTLAFAQDLLVKIPYFPVDNGNGKTVEGSEQLVKGLLNCTRFRPYIFLYLFRLSWYAVEQSYIELTS